MSNLNNILKFIVCLILLIITIIIKNYYMFWILLFYLLFLTIVDRNFKALLVDFVIACVLLFCYYDMKARIIIKILFSILLCLLYFSSFSKKKLETYGFRSSYIYDSSNRKKLFLNKYRPLIEKENIDKFSSYDKYISLEDRNKKDLELKYLYAKVRFYGYGRRMSNFAYKKFDLYDVIFLIVFCLVLGLLYYMGS